MEFREPTMVPRFQFDRRPGRSRLKGTCPKCGRPRCFTYYIDTVTGEPVGTQYGRCDHERRCGYDNRPTGKDVAGKPLFVTNNEVKAAFKYPARPDIANCIPMDEWMSSVRPAKNNTLFRFIAALWGEAEAEAALRRYHVGTKDIFGWKGCPVFWQVDRDYTCRSGKIMEYSIKKDESGNPIDIKRVKGNDGEMPHIFYYHALYGYDYIFRGCLFGEHLLGEYPPTTEVNLVESEKTAVIMSIACPGKPVLATGGLNNLREAVMEPLKGRKITAWPDKGDAYYRWAEISKDKLPGYNITFSDALQKMKGAADGEDVADVIIRKRIKQLNNKSELFISGLHLDI